MENERWKGLRERSSESSRNFDLDDATKGCVARQIEIRMIRDNLRGYVWSQVWGRPRANLQHYEDDQSFFFFFFQVQGLQFGRQAEIFRENGSSHWSFHENYISRKAHSRISYESQRNYKAIYGSNVQRAWCLSRPFSNKFPLCCKD